MPIFRMMIGLPGAGKSSFLLNLREECWEVVSSDTIRSEMYGDENDQSHNNEIFNEMLRRTINALYGGRNVAYDATNVNAKRRAHLIKELSRRVKGISIYFEAVVVATPFEECVRRNYLRERRVPVNVILSMMKRFEMPAVWEGWDNILVYNCDEYTQRNIYAYRKADILLHSIHKMADRMDQDNPHHTLTVGGHMKKAAELYRNEAKDYDANIWRALTLHDIAKPYCKTFINSRGDVTDVAHFYGHDCASAYVALSLWAIPNLNHNLIDGDIEVINLIQHHMAFYRGENYLEKIRQRYGNEFFEKLKVVHKYDQLSH